MRRRYTREQRAQLLDLVAVGDVTVPEAAARLGVTSSAAYNWVAERRRLARPSGARLAASPTFVRLVPGAAADSSIVIRVAGTEIQVRRGFDGELLQAVVASLVEVAQ